MKNLIQKLNRLTFVSSLVLNVALFLIVVGLVIALIWRDLIYHSYRDGRPQGPLLTLPQDYQVFSRADGGIAFTLPKGVVLQESTPHGMATLGKNGAKEYILIIHSFDRIEDGSKLLQDIGWMDHYRF